MQAVDVDTREPVYAPLNIHMQPPRAAAASQVATKAPRPSQVCVNVCSDRQQVCLVWILAGGRQLVCATLDMNLQRPPLRCPASS